MIVASRTPLACCGMGQGLPFPFCCQRLSSEKLLKDVLPESSLTSHAFLCPRLQNSAALSSVGVALGSHVLYSCLWERSFRIKPSFRFSFKNKRRPTKWGFIKATLPEEGGGRDMPAREHSGFGSALSPTTSCCGVTFTHSKLRSHTRCIRTPLTPGVEGRTTFHFYLL